MTRIQETSQEHQRTIIEAIKYRYSIYTSLHQGLIGFLGRLNNCGLSGGGCLPRLWLEGSPQPCVRALQLRAEAAIPEPTMDTLDDLQSVKSGSFDPNRSSLRLTDPVAWTTHALLQRRDLDSSCSVSSRLTYRTDAGTHARGYALSRLPRCVAPAYPIARTPELQAVVAIFRFAPFRCDKICVFFSQQISILALRACTLRKRHVTPSIVRSTLVAPILEAV